MSMEPDATDRWAVGDRVRVDIPDETHPDHHRYHGRHGSVIAIIPRRTPDESPRSITGLRRSTEGASESAEEPRRSTESATERAEDSRRSPEGSTEPAEEPATCAYRVEFDDGGYGDVRFVDLRPPIIE